MAPLSSQSANSTSSSTTEDSSSIPSKTSLSISDASVTPTLDVSSDIPSESVTPTPDASDPPICNQLPTETNSTIVEEVTIMIDKDGRKVISNSTESTDVPKDSGGKKGNDCEIAPSETGDGTAITRTTLATHDSLISLGNGTATDESSFGNVPDDPTPKDASTSSVSLSSEFTRTAPPTSTSDTSNIRVGNEGATNGQASPTTAVSDPSTHNTAAPALFSSATTITESGTVFVLSTFASTFEITLPNGVVQTTSKAFTTHVPVPSAESNDSDDGPNRAQNLPGPFEANPPSNETFFQRPAAATGVFVVVGLVIGSLIWMFCIVRRHRRQVAIASKERKRPSYMYGSTGVSPRDRRSYASYESQNWPERFDRHEIDNVASTSQATIAANPLTDSQTRPSCAPTTTELENPQMGLVFPSTLPMNHPIIRSQSQRGPSVFRTMSPPIPARSPLRPWSPPASTSINIAPVDHSQGIEYTNAYGFGSNQPSPTSASGLLVPPMLMPLSRTTSSSQRSRQRASSSTSFNPHPYPMASTSSSMSPPSSSNAAISSRSVHARAASESSAENPFRSSAYIVLSPTPSGELRGSNERLSNPFEDAESPPHSPVAFTYVRDGGATQAVVLERGVSLRRNDSLRNKPEHTQSYVTPDASTAEWGSSGSDAASSSIHINAANFSKAASRYRPMECRNARKSGSVSTTETSVVNSVHRFGSLDEGELFYDPALAVASPERVDNPEFPEVKR